MKCLHYCLFNLSRRDRVVNSAFLTFFMPNENESKCRINCDRFCRVWRFCSTKFKLLYQIDSGADLLPYLIFISHDRFGTWLERRLNRAIKCWASRIYHVNESQQPLKVSCQGYTWPFGYSKTRTFFIAYSFYIFFVHDFFRYARAYRAYRWLRPCSLGLFWSKKFGRKA